MKTKGLTFLEAVKALENKECEQIMSENGNYYHIVGSIVSVKNMNYDGIRTVPHTFLGEWSLIGVKQKAVFTGVEWHSDLSNSPGNIYPTVKEWEKFQDLANKPEMKMTLEWEE